LQSIRVRVRELEIDPKLTKCDLCSPEHTIRDDPKSLHDSAIFGCGERTPGHNVAVLLAELPPRRAIEPTAALKELLAAPCGTPTRSSPGDGQCLFRAQDFQRVEP
jgi:hypothetical protein